MINPIAQALKALIHVFNAISIVLRRYPRTIKHLDALSIQLEKSPNQITAADIISLIIWACLKYIPGYSPSLKARNASQVFELPILRAEGLLKIDDGDVKKFRESLLQRQPAALTNAFFLVAQTVPLIIFFLVNRACPIRPFGAVNTRNVITLAQPALCRDSNALQNAAKQNRLTYNAFLGGPVSVAHRRKRGVEFCITIEIHNESDLVMRQECWFLQFLPASFQPRYQPAQSKTETADQTTKSTTLEAEYSLRMTLDDALRWAASSKDYDGIHVSPLLARLFGFQGVLAHGNHVAALAVQQLVDPENGASRAESQPGQSLWYSQEPRTLEIKFIRPMLLPATLQVQWRCEQSSEANSQLAVLRNGKICMEGHCN